MAYGKVTLTDVQQDLSFLLGELNVPSSGIDDRNRFIQRTLEEAWRAYPWEFSKTTATVAPSSGVATVASGAMLEGTFDVRYVTSGSGDDHIYSEIPYEESDDYSAGSYRYWITGSTPNPVINTKETETPLQVRYQAIPPQINASVSTNFPDSQVLALGALRYVRIGENPTADIVQEESNFQARLEELWGQYNRVKPRARRRVRFGSTGRVGGDGGDPTNDSSYRS